MLIRSLGAYWYSLRFCHNNKIESNALASKLKSDGLAKEMNFTCFIVLLGKCIQHGKVIRKNDRSREYPVDSSGPSVNSRK